MEALQDTIHIVVGTPRRITDHLSRGTLILDGVCMVVLDEADRMLNMGFKDDIEYILSRIPSERQTAMFSATMPEEILELASQNMYNPEELLVSRDEIAVEEIEQLYHLVDPERKLQALSDIMSQKSVKRACVFCSTKIGADRLAWRLRRVRFLLATDVASRGLDIQGVLHVVNHDLLHNPLLYFHRIGRTGRAGASGIGVASVSRREMGDLQRIQGMTNSRIHEFREQLSPSLHQPSRVHASY
jgi:ATP-dependent RNA helicase DeaD